MFLTEKPLCNFFMSDNMYGGNRVNVVTRCFRLEIARSNDLLRT